MNPYQHQHQNQQQQQQPPPYQYAYPQPPHYQRERPPAPHHSRLAWWYSITRPWAIVVPFVTLIMDVWWFSTGRLCGYVDNMMDECFWVLWLSFPLALVSVVWNLATTISARRAQHYRRGIPIDVQLPAQALVACGATVCLALLAWHYAVYMDRIWGSHLEGAMIALICIIMIVNWMLVVYIAYEWQEERRQRQGQESYVL